MCTADGMCRALMAVIEEVTATYDKVRSDDTYLAELDRLQRQYTRPPVATV